MTIEKMNFHYPKGNLQSVYSHEEMTALELAAATSGKVDECIEVVNGVEQSAIEATQIVDNMRFQQDNFITDNTDIRAQIIIDNQNLLDDLSTENQSFQTGVNLSKTNFETNMNLSLLNFENGINLSKETFETDIQTSKETFENNMTDSITTIIETSNQIIKTDVNNKVDELITDGTIETLINDNILNDVKETIKDLNCNVKTYGAIGDGINNDTSAILSALNYLKPTGGVLFFPYGTYLTDSIDLTEFKNIVLLGYNETTNFPYKNQSVIKIKNTCAVGIKCSDTNNEIPAFSGQGISIKNLYIDCNFKATIGINMNSTVHIENVSIRYANGDGLVLEGSSYPVTMKKVVSQYHKGNGVKIKAPYTTVYNFYECEFGFNDGYGMYIEDGSTSTINNVLLQTNKRGGLRIIQSDPSFYTYPVFLERLTFNNLYLEANGTLAVDAPNYDGNFGIKIDGINSDPSTNYGKIVDLTFINCSNNKSPQGQTSSIKGTYGLTNIGCFGINVDSTYNVIPAINTPTPLDNYEEGTFELELGQSNMGNFTKTGTTLAKYIKIGKLVNCFIDISWLDKGTGNSAYFLVMKNLPYNIDNNFTSMSPLNLIVSGGSTDRLFTTPETGSNQMFFNKNGEIGEMIIDTFPASGRIAGSFSYISQ